MRSLRLSRVECFLLGLAAVLSSAPVLADEPRGKGEYVRYCSACHGEEADGKGPVANVLTPRPPALTRLNPKYGRPPLGTTLVAYIMGGTMPRAHGSSDMPVWGRNLDESDAVDDTKAVRTIWLIVDYLQSIQAK